MLKIALFINHWKQSTGNTLTSESEDGGWGVGQGSWKHYCTAVKWSAVKWTDDTLSPAPLEQQRERLIKVSLPWLSNDGRSDTALLFLIDLSLCGRLSGHSALFQIAFCVAGIPLPRYSKYTWTYCHPAAFWCYRKQCNCLFYTWHDVNVTK